MCYCQIYLPIIHRMTVTEWLTKCCHPCEQNETRETLLGFNMVNYRACKNLWKACVEHHTFFRLERPIPPQKNFFAHYFTLGSKFRYWWEQQDKTSLHQSEQTLHVLRYLWKWANLIGLNAWTQSRVEVFGVNPGCSFAIKLVANIGLFASKFLSCFIFNLCFQKSSVKVVSLL